MIPDPVVVDAPAITELTFRVAAPTTVTAAIPAIAEPAFSFCDPVALIIPLAEISDATLRMHAPTVV